MHSTNHSQVIGPYVKDEQSQATPSLQAVYDLRTSSTEDADSDRKALLRWSQGSRLTLKCCKAPAWPAAGTSGHPGL
ncbi:hypothetical protein LY76DRAFT_598550 [Colletotrichum caudatum]|nr:hypothetical protein LY76DRAFT_598550 [Colletotrichum caudatum]